MANLKEIRNRIGSVSSTMQITSAMKMVSAAKLKKAQDAITAMRPYAEKLTELLQNLSSTLDGDVGGEFTTQREVKKVLMVAITSNSLARVNTCCKVISAMASLIINFSFHCPFPWVGNNPRAVSTSLRRSACCAGTIIKQPGSINLAFSSADLPDNNLEYIERVEKLAGSLKMDFPKNVTYKKVLQDELTKRYNKRAKIK